LHVFIIITSTVDLFMFKQFIDLFMPFFKSSKRHITKTTLALFFLSLPITGFSNPKLATIASQVSKSKLNKLDILLITIDIFCLIIAFLGLKWWQLKKQLQKNNQASKDLIWHQAHFDSLTNLPNRRFFQEKLAKGVKNANMRRQPLALLLLDLDGFKQVNDSLGHVTGDLLLKEVANRISNSLHSDDTVARLGGDEFTVILEKVKDAAGIEQAADKILSALNKPFTLGEHTIHISTSIGITIFPTDSSDTHMLLKNADQAMYAAKRLGKNCFQFFTQDMQRSIEAQIKIMQDLRSALAKKEFELHYQPIVELSTNKIAKAEALIRWMHPTDGCISPLDFIPIVEEIGLIVPIGDWAYIEACKFLKRIQKEYHQHFQISINVSPKQFHQKNGIGSNEQQFLIGKNAAEGIIIEITEGLVLDLTEEVKTQLNQIREAGIETAIDDFGTGYSSLAYLKKFHIDYIKIDRSFVSNIESNNNDKVLCEVIVQMANKLGFKVVAEGIETKAQLDFLKSIGCRYGQGFYFSKALPEDAFIQFILNPEKMLS
jgi:diguanylate cyclase (GGDEF)-like protein